MKQLFTILTTLLFTATTFSQTGIGTTTPNASAQLEVSSTTKGFLPPRMTTIQRDAITNPATGLVVYNTTTNVLEYKTTSNWVSLISNPNGANTGEMQYWDGSDWVSIPLGSEGQILKLTNNTPTWSTIGTTYYLDADSDGFGDNANSVIANTVPYAYYVSDNTDCDDTDADEFPGQTWYIDADGDGYGISSTLACARPTHGLLLSELLGSGTDDCDDSDASATNVSQTWYIDTDADGYGSSTIFADTFKELSAFLSEETELRQRLLASGYIRDYAYTNAFEFVAVIIETFIETPAEFKAQFPSVYAKTKQMLNFNFEGY